MCDVYIYYFKTSNRPDGKNTLSRRPATLDAIKGRGKPVMESQIVVDHTELDADGFLVAAIGNHSNATDEIAFQIWSLEVRAASRDSAALRQRRWQGTIYAESRKPGTAQAGSRIEESAHGKEGR